MSMLVVGLMSGTSLDGIDASLVKMEGYKRRTRMEVLKSISLPYNDELKQELLLAINKTSSNVEQICSLNFKMGYVFANAVKAVCKEANIHLHQLDLIGSHGQTLYHIPKAHHSLAKSTLQVGDPSIIAYETNTVVVSNFRTMDIAAGGEGAPLIPYMDWLLFRDENKGRILQNIGGIGNCTVIPKNAQINEIYAFDTGPGNMIIDELCRKLCHLPFDEGGRIAAKGKVHKDIVDRWMQHAYFRLVPPKSTGREDFGSEYTKEILTLSSNLPPEDLIATATYFTAFSIVDAYKKFVFPNSEVSEIILSGGGGNNHTLIKMIEQLLPTINVFTIDQLGITTDEKEAVGFAVLANETIHQQQTNVPKATGAIEPVILGQIALPPYGDHKQILKKGYNNKTIQARWENDGR
ncbi:MAG: anhydro-N-acetylmuramic acid kinase AnmK [Virgibacillus proomii]